MIFILQTFTYVVNGGRDDWSALGDHYDPKYEHQNISYRHKFFWKEHPKGTSRHCHFDLVVYPSQEFEDGYHSNAPALYAAIVLVVFAFTAIVFVIYSYIVGKRQRHVETKAAGAEAIVASLFPQEIGERLLAEAREREQEAIRKKKKMSLSEWNGLDASGHGAVVPRSKPLADLFPNATVMCT